MSAASVESAAELLRRTAGFRFREEERARLHRCLRDLAGEQGTDVDGVVRNLAVDPSLMRALLERVTVQESNFFRDQRQFDAFADEVLPTLPPGSMIWSAGCANGQEVWSLAMLLHERKRTDMRVLGTDISLEALKYATDGRYTRREVRDLSAEHRRRFFSNDDEGRYVVSPALRSLVDFREHNLAAGDAPVSIDSCAVVFCRNVLIYMEPSVITRLLDRLGTWLPPGAWLFAGFSESLQHYTQRFDLKPIGGAFAYRLRGSDEPEPRPRMSASEPRRRPKVVSEPGALRHTAPTTVSQVDALLQDGARAMSAGEATSAVVAYRRAAYLDPTSFKAHLHLALALDETGDAMAARRSYSTALTCLKLTNPEKILDEAEGYGIRDLEQMLEERTGRGS